MDAPSQMQIGAIAKETGVSIDTIRFYEKQGLLKQQLRTQGAFRLFQEADVEGLKFIRNAQELGFRSSKSENGMQQLAHRRTKA